MRPKRGNTYINQAAQMDSTHKQVLRQRCCAQKIDLERENHQICVARLERTKECIKTMYCENHIQQRRKKWGGNRGENEQPSYHPCHL